MALTKYNYNSFNITPVASKALAFNSDADGLTTAAEGSMVLIKTVTASSDSTISFVNGSDDVVLDSTYSTYIVTFISVHPSANAKLKVNFTTDGTNWNVTKTTSYFIAYHDEGDATPNIAYQTGEDLSQGTGVQTVSQEIGTDNDQSGSGSLHLFNPSSTTFVKHFFSRSSALASDDYLGDGYCAGYCNTTSAVTGIRFTAASGNIDAGTFKLYGFKES